jgi:hypothetical protein
VAQPPTRTDPMGLPWKDGGRTQRFLDILNTPIAVVAVLIVVVAVNAFLYFGYYAPAVPTAPPAKTTLLPGERTRLLTTLEPTGEEKREGQKPQETTLETTPSRGRLLLRLPPALAPLLLPNERNSLPIIHQWNASFSLMRPRSAWNKYSWTFGCTFTLRTAF